MTSNAGPSLFLTGGVDACSYSKTRLRAGGEGVALALNRLTELALTAPSSALSCNDAASAASSADCSSPLVVSALAGDRATAGWSSWRKPCWEVGEFCSIELWIVAVASGVGSGSIKRMVVVAGSLGTEPVMVQSRAARVGLRVRVACWSWSREMGKEGQAKVGEIGSWFHRYYSGSSAASLAPQARQVAKLMTAPVSCLSYFTS